MFCPAPHRRRTHANVAPDRPDFAALQTEAVANDFLAAWLADRAAGREHPLAHYQARFPGHEALIAAEHARLLADDPDDLDAPAHEPDLPDIPDVVLAGVIGRGGQGVVYRGRQSWLDRPVAVKVLSAAWRPPDHAERFRREARTLAGLHHPHIVACHQAGTTGTGACYLVMELVNGPSLRRWLQDHGPLPPHVVAALGRDLAAALAHAHRAGIVHRDVKPENVLLQPRAGAGPDDPFPFVAKLADLGIARPTPGPQGPTLVTPAGALLGTPATMAPEQFDAPDAVDHRADVYGLGCVLWHALAGRPAFPPAAITEMIVAKTTRPPPDVRGLVAGVPPELAALVARMLARRPEDRPQDLDELGARLGQFTQPAGAPGPRPRARSAVAIGAGLLLCLLAAAWFTWGRTGAAAAPVLIMEAPATAAEGTPVTLTATLPGLADPGTTAFRWRQLAGPDVGASATAGPELHFAAPRGAADAELAFEVTATAAGMTTRSEARLRIVGDPACPPLAAGERRALCEPTGDQPLHGWSGDAAATAFRDEETGGARLRCRSGGVAVTRPLPGGHWTLSGALDPRYQFRQDQPRMRLREAALRLELAGGHALLLLLTPVPDVADRYRCALVRQQRAADGDGWLPVATLAEQLGAWGQAAPMPFRLTWQDQRLQVQWGEGGSAEVQPRDWGARWAPAQLALCVTEGDLCIRDLVLEGLP